MDVLTPADWVEAHASATPDRTALVFPDGDVTYGQLMELISKRAATLDDLPIGRVIPVVVRLDLASIVELFAVQRIGGCPLPTLDQVAGLPDDPSGEAVVCIRTSGSSGAPRFVPLTMANLTASAEASRARLRTGADDTWLSCLPLNHIGGLSVLFRSFQAGGTAVVAPFDAELPAVISASRPTVASFVPTMVHRLLDDSPTSLASIATNLVGGSHAPASMLDRATREGVQIIPTYGMTEAASQVATPDPTSSVPRAGFVGRPLDGFVVTVEMARDEREGIGVISVDGPAVFGGYVGETPRIGPFRTTDVGWLDEGGNLNVVGRVDDVVVSGGENVSLDHVQDVLLGLSVVREAAAVALDDPEWGSVVCAMVASGSSVDVVRTRAGEILAPHEVPRRWLVVTSLPLLPNGKHDLASIRAVFDDW